MTELNTVPLWFSTTDSIFYNWSSQSKNNSNDESVSFDMKAKHMFQF